MPAHPVAGPRTRATAPTDVGDASRDRDQCCLDAAGSLLVGASPPGAAPGGRETQDLDQPRSCLSVHRLRLERKRSRHGRPQRDRQSRCQGSTDKALSLSAVDALMRSTRRDVSSSQPVKHGAGCPWQRAGPGWDRPERPARGSPQAARASPSDQTCRAGPYPGTRGAPKSFCRRRARQAGAGSTCLRRGTGRGGSRRWPTNGPARPIRHVGANIRLRPSVAALSAAGPHQTAPTRRRDLIARRSSMAA